MRRLTYRVALEPVAQQWAENLIAAMFAGVPPVGRNGVVVSPRRPLARVKLATGSHLVPGATYTVRGLTDGWPRASILVDSWSPQTTTVLSAVILGKRRGAAVARGEYAHKPQPGVVTVSGAVRPRPGKVSLLQVSASAEVDLATLYTGSGAGKRDVIAAGRLESPAGTVSAEVRRQPMQGPRWQFQVTVAFSHWYTLPLLKSAFLIERRLGRRRKIVERVSRALGGPQLRQQAGNDLDYVERLIEQALRMAESAWNAEVPGLVARDAASVADEILSEIATDPGSDSRG